MTPLEETLLWVGAIASVFVSALCAGMEIACYSINRVRLALRAGKSPPDRPARLIRAELEQPDRLLATLLICINIATYLGALATTELIETKVSSAALIALVNTCILAPIMFIFAEALPKELFRIESDRLAYLFATPLSVSRILLTGTGILPLIRGLNRLVERIAGLPEESISDARQRIAMLLKEGAGHGVLSESQVTLVDRALMLRTVTVADEMVPWSLVRTLPLGVDRARAVRIIGSSRHAFIPVIGEVVRHSGSPHRGLGLAAAVGGAGATGAQSGLGAFSVVGVVSQLDLYLNPKQAIAELVRPVVRLKRLARVREALLLLREHNAAMGIIEDDHGRPLGIVTAKDLVEPLIGGLANL